MTNVIIMVLAIIVFLLTILNSMGTLRVIKAWEVREQRWDAERSKLMDRIQARDLGEFKALSEPSKPREVKPTDDIVEI